MITLAYREIKKARKNHICDYCKQFIEKGNSYDRSIHIYDSFYMWKSHISCSKLVVFLNMNYDSDYGITSDDFIEYINNSYSTLFPNSDKNHTDFKSRLKALINYFEI